MTQFDNLLRQGLMDANLEEYESILQQSETETPDFSPQYRRERTRLLADPWNWGRKQPRRRNQTRPMLRWGISHGIAAAIAIILLVTAAAAVTVALWITFFGGLDQRQQEIVDDMVIGDGDAAETAAESLLPPPVEHDDVTITPLSILGARNQLYMVLEIRAPEGTVFHQEDNYQLFASTKRPENAPAEMLGHSGRFTVLEAGTKEPNVLLGVAEEKASYDISGCTYQIRALYRYTPDGGRETIFEASDNVTWKTGTWDILIPEELNGDQVMEIPVDGVSMTDGQKTMTLISMHVSPLGIWWKYHLDGEDPWPQVRIALRMKDGTEIEADPRQLTMGDMGSGFTGTVSFEKPVDLSQAESVLWGDVEIPLEQPTQNQS